MMKVLNFLALIICLSFIQTDLRAQSEKKSFSLTKGQIIDVLLLNNNPEAEAKRQAYFKAIFPIASMMGYNPLPGFSITESPTQGNYAPDYLALAYWKNLEARKETMKKIEAEIPDFHQQRREIWPTFNMTYYEVKQDISFEINPNKFYIATAYWAKDSKSFQKFKKKWVKKTQNSGGEILVTLEDGESPFGYYYNPDYLTITEWENKATFDAFYKENLQMDHSAVQHVNQFNIK